MGKVNEAKVIPHKRDCKCRGCVEAKRIEAGRELEAKALITKANIWLRSHVTSMKIFVSDFIKIEVKQPEVKSPVKKRTPRKQKE